MSAWHRLVSQQVHTDRPALTQSLHKAITSVPALYTQTTTTSNTRLGYLNSSLNATSSPLWLGNITFPLPLNENITSVISFQSVQPWFGVGWVECIQDLIVIYELWARCAWHKNGSSMWVSVRQQIQNTSPNTDKTRAGRGISNCSLKVITQQTQLSEFTNRLDHIVPIMKRSIINV